jgi:hypothetical protein
MIGIHLQPTKLPIIQPTVIDALDSSQIMGGIVSSRHFKSASQKLERSLSSWYNRWKTIGSDFFGITDTALSQIEKLSNDDNIPTEFVFFVNPYIIIPSNNFRPNNL